MLSKAELKRRKQQSLRDKANRREEQDRIERRFQQSLRDRQRHRVNQLQLSPTCITSNTAISQDLTEHNAIDVDKIRLKAMMTSSPQRMDVPPYFARMFNNPTFADVTILVGDAEIPAHRVILGSQSRHFETALTEDFLESTARTLRCPAEKEHAYLRVLQFIYQGDYAEQPSDLITNEDDHELLRDPQVYFLADSFFLSALKSLALDKFKAKLEDLWVSERFVDCISEIYTNTPSGSDDGMRAGVIQVCTAHIHELLSRKSFLVLIEAGGDFSVELVTELARNMSM